MYGTRTHCHKHYLSPTATPEDHLEAPKIKALAYARLPFDKDAWHQGCLHNSLHAGRRWLLDGSSPADVPFENEHPRTTKAPRLQQPPETIRLPQTERPDVDITLPGSADGPPGHLSTIQRERELDLTQIRLNHCRRRDDRFLKTKEARLVCWQRGYYHKHDWSKKEGTPRHGEPCDMRQHAKIPQSHQDPPKSAPRNTKCMVEEKAEEIQACSDQRDMRCFYAAVKEIYGPTRSSINHLKDVDGTTMLSEPDRIPKRWKNRFETLFNNHSTTPADLLRNSPQAPTQHWMSEPPTPDELTKAMKRIEPGKEPGPDNVLFELLNSAGPALKSRLMVLLTQIWNSDSVPPNFKNANIIAIFKKG